MGKKEDKITEPLKKYKQRMKRTCCCGAIWMLLGIVFVVVGVVFLAFNYDSWGDDDETNKRNMAYAGVVLLIIGLVMALIGIIIVLVLYKVYKRITGGRKKDNFKPPTFAAGKAPYPQQPQASPPPQSHPPAAEAHPGMPQPSAPPGSGPVHTDDLHVEIDASTNRL